MNFDIDEMIKECEELKEKDEVVVFGIGAGRIIPQLFHIIRMRKALKYISALEGFAGIIPIDIWHTILVFDTLNHAKAGRNDLVLKGMKLGNIAPLVVKKEYLRKEM